MAEVSRPNWVKGERFKPSGLEQDANRSSFVAPRDTPLRIPASPSGGSKVAFGRTQRAKAKPKGDLDLPPTESLKINRRVSSLNGDDSSFRDDTPSQSMLGNPSTPKRSEMYNLGHSVIVFGFPAGHRTSVLQYFSKFGDILEDPSHSQTPGQSPTAVVCGRNWMRLTYRDRSAHQRALAENGTMIDGQYVIGATLPDGSSVRGSISSLVGEEDMSLDDVRSITGGINSSEGDMSISTPLHVETASKLSIEAPTSSLFRQETAGGAAFQTPPTESDTAPKGWVAWAKTKSRDLLFGSEDI